MAETIFKTERFSDQGELIYEFNEEFLVVCPKCRSMARVFPLESGSEKLSNKLTARRKLVCLNCAYRAEHSGKNAGIGEARDWYFRLPLCLAIECGGNVLWAYSKRHLDFIENYVGARLRQRVPHVNKSVASRLPQWILSAKNRDEILKCIAKLRAKLPKENEK